MALVIGTAGHIDHGKTSLVNYLTGVGCDRLKEEKERGITIELGFARLDLPDGTALSLIDVPGHERFVHTMVSGATGIDFVLLVIAADEGVMPQTREHLDICTLLGIRHGAIILTKTDMVDAELLELAEEDIASFLQTTFLADAPIFPVSSLTGSGMQALQEYLYSLPRIMPPRIRTDLFRLPIDRVFTMKGHGTVVTGTMLAGTLAVGDDVMVYPQEHLAKVRNLQNHGYSASLVPSGHRTAINLQGLAVDEIAKGDVLARPATLFPSHSFVVELTCLASSPKPLRQRTTVHFHHGAKNIQAQLYFPQCDDLQPGQTALCEVRFAEPLTGVFHDHCVIRSFSPLQTVAGGTVIFPCTLPLQRKNQHFTITCEHLAGLAASLSSIDSSLTAQQQEEQTVALRISHALALLHAQGASFAMLMVLTGASSKQLEKALALLGSKQQVVCFDKEQKKYVAASALEALQAEILTHISSYHQKHPMKVGVSRTELLSGWKKQLDAKLAHILFERLIKEKQLLQTDDLIHLATHKPSLAADQEKLRHALLDAHQRAGMTPPNLKDVLDALRVDQKAAMPVLQLLQKEGLLLKVADGLWYDAQTVQDIKQQVVTWFLTHEHIDIAGLKEITGLSRKYLVALLEYFDSIRLTARVGDSRILRDKNA